MESPGLRAGRIPHLRLSTHPTCTLLQLRPARLQRETRGGKRCRPWLDLTDGESGGILCRRVLACPHVVTSSRCASIAASVTTGQQAMCTLQSCCAESVFTGHDVPFPAVGIPPRASDGRWEGSSEDTSPEQDMQREPATSQGNSALRSLKEDRLEHPHTIPHERSALQADVKSLL